MEALPTNDDEDVKIAGRENYIKMQELMRAEELAEKQRQAKDKEKEEQQKEKENDDHQNAKTAEDTETTKNSSASDPAGYYALLGISPSSQPSPAEIKRAFTHKALEMHPDKNLNDPEANMKFQQLMKAYQILHNPVSRHAYDHPEHLTDNELEELYNRNSHFNGVDDNENPLAEIIGSRALEPLIGKLNFVLYFDSNVCYTSEMMKTLEERRRLRIAKQLLEFLDVDIVNGLSSTNEISKNNDNKKLDYGLERATNVIKEALSTRLGPVFVHAVAETYHIAAKQHLYNNMVKREISSWWENKRLSWQSTTQIVSASIAALKRAANKTISEEDVMRLLEVANLADIKRHVLRACRMTLYDVSVTPEQRMRRAERLEILSQLTFQLVDEELALRAVASHDNAAHSAS